MSATGRSDVRKPDDLYETPAWVTHRLLEEVDLPGGHWLEPCAASGAIIKAVNEKRDVNWTAVELRSEAIGPLRDLLIEGREDGTHHNRVLEGDFVPLDGPVANAMTRERSNWGGGRYNVCITNPPFSLAMEFVLRSMADAAWVVMLLRLNWLGSEDRSGFLRRYPPDIYPLPNRPSFTENGKTDATEYSWFVWPPDRFYDTRTHGKIKVLGSTPKAIRCPKPPT